MEKKLNNSHFYTCKALMMLVTLKLTIVAILMASLVLGATQWTLKNVGRIVVFLHVQLKVGVFSRVKLSVLFSSTVGCVWNFQIGGGSIKAIFQSRKLKFDIVLYFGLINSPTVAKKFSCKNEF